MSDQLIKNMLDRKLGMESELSTLIVLLSSIQGGHPVVLVSNNNYSCKMQVDCHIAEHLVQERIEYVNTELGMINCKLDAINELLKG